MNQKGLSMLALMIVTTLTTSFLIKSGSCRLDPPVVNVIPPETSVGQEVFVNATIYVVSC